MTEPKFSKAPIRGKAAENSQTTKNISKIWYETANYLARYDEEGMVVDIIGRSPRGGKAKCDTPKSELADKSKGELEIEIEGAYHVYTLVPDYKCKAIIAGYNALQEFENRLKENVCKIISDFEK